LSDLGDLIDGNRSQEAHEERCLCLVRRIGDDTQDRERLGRHQPRLSTQGKQPRDQDDDQKHVVEEESGRSEERQKVIEVVL
jgi:hypothetical protein